MTCFSNSRRWLSVLLVLIASLLAGCATQTRALLSQTDPGIARRIELSSTPFFAQEDYQCGPAALATVLRTADIQISPDQLVSQVYVPAKKGSLAPEMMAAARRNGALAMTIPPRLDALLAEVRAGNPVVIMQNLSLPIYPLWHYAVVIGYDLGRESVLLRSGTTQRLEMAMSTFEHTWARSGYWGLVAMPPGRLPVTVAQADAVSALVAFEKNTDPLRARQAYAAGLKQWPDNLVLQLGSANAAYAAGDRDAALSALWAATSAHPDSVPALNNLASLLAEKGRLDEARAVAEKAVAQNGPMHDAAIATLNQINEQQREAGRGKRL